MELYDQILERSEKVDNDFSNLNGSEIDSIKIKFKVPNFHPRNKEVKEYVVSALKIEDLTSLELYKTTKNKVFLIDKVVSEQGFVKEFLKNNEIEPFILESVESKLKTRNFLKKFIQENNLKSSLIVAMGGGILLNSAAFIAEQTSSNLISFPTTVLAMADGTGGKVRVNTLAFGRAYKHYYKSYYEPNAFCIDDRFLDSLSDPQISVGLVEIIKHGLFQSPKLHEYIMQSGKELFADKQKLKKVIYWAIDLKRVCLEIDVEENENGSRKILRAGHDFSDRLEEDMKLEITHGYAVSIGIIEQLEYEKDDKMLAKAKKIFDLFDIPKTVEEYENL